MRLAYGVFHWSPDVFWSMGFLEWILAIEGHSGVGAEQFMTGDRLHELMREHPD